MIKFTGNESVDELIDVIVRNSGMSKKHALIAVAYSLEWASNYATRQADALYAAADFYDFDGPSLENGDMK